VRTESEKREKRREKKSKKKSLLFLFFGEPLADLRSSTDPTLAASLLAISEHHRCWDLARDAAAPAEITPPTSAPSCRRTSARAYSLDAPGCRAKHLQRCHRPYPQHHQ